MSFKFLIFLDFINFESMRNGTFMRRHILDLFMKNWPSNRIKFKNSTPYATNLVLISGYFKFLKERSSTVSRTPSFFSLEFRQRVPSFKSHWKLFHCKNEKSRGCLAMKLCFGMCHMPFSDTLALIERSLGNFVDFL